MTIKTFKIFLLIVIISISTQSQETDLSIFKNLIGKKWKAEGKWGDGTVFKQETIFKFDLDNTLVITRSKGFVDPKQTKYGWRNHGIRKFDKETKTIKFWEFDIFGGVTEGAITVDGKNLIYQYQYGKSIVTDMWEYVNDHTYNFKVGEYVDSKWKQVYLETKFKAKKSDNSAH
ncbi:hypothetical protein D1818_10610 [Aquimarina sp. BL5]|uniref:hypothetical protein n=1 Tax=Aquimarina sp. BL5 TaxID=1714860 RepID=UPI000E4F01AA|nr:hypothetical protein [Aquimarina sp. BL5]AXT51256.1 hypothetical protein D1818_10610 [Aquimarina sp. BL5]RKN09467.1 hypothetical protein D7036_04130 [Aquimarina sp. BL5]